ncbi:MAG: diguanylate cyclase (GGDEF)-like protein [Candidatus Azotimanducaceae bacterium]|jgi:diguanylate cyclase (GGDEF)-like protein
MDKQTEHYPTTSAEGDSQEAPNGSEQAAVDIVTGLPNRVCFQDRLGLAIRCAERYDLGFAILFLDLDRFKNVNDTLGHSAGDEVLKEIAHRVAGCVRESDTVARLGGDEFTIILFNLKEPELVARVAEKIVGLLRMPFTVQGREFHLSASVGIAMYPQDGHSAELLVRNADTAMYEVKKGTKNGFHFYAKEMSERALERMELEEDLRRAIAEEQFEMHYQSIVDSYTGDTVCAEALIRWRHPVKGLLSPDEFIPLAEETGLIVELGVWVLNTSCRQAAAWQQAGYQPISLAINISMLQFEQGDLIETIMDALVASNLDARWLELELTEGALLKNPDHAHSLLKRLRELGMHIAIDDFGTGYSSLLQLRQLPIDSLKIDRAFVHGIPDIADDMALVELIVDLGRKLNLGIVAEGVETSEQLEFLRSLGCSRCQGYLFSMPMPAHEFARFLRPGSRGVGSTEDLVPDLQTQPLSQTGLQR